MMICQECGMEIDGNEYHPYYFCVLVKAGCADPVAFVLEAASHITTAAPNAADATWDNDYIDPDMYLDEEPYPE